MPLRFLVTTLLHRVVHLVRGHVTKVPASWARTSIDEQMPPSGRAVPILLSGTWPALRPGAGREHLHRQTSASRRTPTTKKPCRSSSTLEQRKSQVLPDQNDPGRRRSAPRDHIHSSKPNDHDIFRHLNKDTMGNLAADAGYVSRELEPEM